MLEGPIDPETGERDALEERGDGVGPGPVLRSRHEVLLHAVAEDVEETADLRQFLVGDDDRLVAPRPERALPVVHAADLFGDVCPDEGHESGELPRALGGEQQVQVVREDHEGVQDHPVARLGAAEDAENELVELRGRPQEKPALHGAAGDLDERAVGQEAERSPHVSVRT